MENVVQLTIDKELLTLLNLKPVAIVTTVGKDGSTNARLSVGSRSSTMNRLGFSYQLI